MVKISKATIVCSILSALLGTLNGAAYSQQYSGPNNTSKFAAGNWMAHGTTLTGPNLSDFQIPHCLRVLWLITGSMCARTGVGRMATA